MVYNDFSEIWRDKTKPNLPFSGCPNPENLNYLTQKTPFLHKSWTSYMNFREGFMNRKQMQ